jgi:hypothetical protein
VLNQLPAGQHAALAGHSFFPLLISHSFRTGLHDAFLFAIVACLIAALASWSRGGNPQSADSGSRRESDGRASSGDAGAVPAGELVRG